MRPACVGSHFNSPRRPKTPAIRPTANSSVAVAVVVLAAARSFFGIQNIHGNAPLGGRANDRAQRLSNAAVAPDNFAEIFGIDDQLNHRLGVFVNKQLDGNAVGLNHQLAREEAQQLGSPPMSRPWIARARSRAALGTRR